MRQSVEAGFAVVVTDARVSNAAKRHGLHKQVDVYLIYRSAAEGQASEEMIDGLLVTAEEEPGEWFGPLLHLKDGRVEVSVREDRQKRPEDLFLHDCVVPRDGIEDCRVDVPRTRIRCATRDHLFLINEARQALDRFRADDARV